RPFHGGMKLAVPTAEAADGQRRARSDNSTVDTQATRETALTSPVDLGRQRWMRLLPVAFVTYSLAYLDRSNFSIAVAGGMKEDLELTGAMSSLIGASFFLGYTVFQIPGTLYAERRSVRGLIFWCTLAWGLIAAVQGLLSNAYLLVFVRFLLGA